jgi:hypothetical protein
LFYPETYHVEDIAWFGPEGSVIAHNIFYNYGKKRGVGPVTWYDYTSGTAATQYSGPDIDNYIDIHDNLDNINPLFVNGAAGNYQLQTNSPAYALGFKRIPFESIGLCDKSMLNCGQK